MRREEAKMFSLWIIISRLRQIRFPRLRLDQHLHWEAASNERKSLVRLRK